MFASSPTASTTSALIVSGISPSSVLAAIKAVVRLKLRTTVPAALPERPMIPLTSNSGLTLSLMKIFPRVSLQLNIVSKTETVEETKGFRCSAFIDVQQYQGLVDRP